MSSASRKTKRDRVDFGRKPRRLAPTQRARKRVLIVGEGQETEHNYFSGLGADPRVKRVFVVLVKRGAGGSAADVVEIAQREIERDRKRFGERPDEIWCVLDVETDAAQRAALARARRVASSHGITVVLSNPSFEAWLLAHFRKSGKKYHSTEELRRTLDKVWRRMFGKAYDRSEKRLYEMLTTKTEDALSNARGIREGQFKGIVDTAECNSATDVYKLVGHLLGVGGA